MKAFFIAESKCKTNWLSFGIGKETEEKKNILYGYWEPVNRVSFPQNT